jgi:uncharacterized repeat protein (TIGR01451 family)
MSAITINTDAHWPRWFRFAVVAVSMVILSACRAKQPGGDAIVQNGAPSSAQASDDSNEISIASYTQIGPFKWGGKAAVETGKPSATARRPATYEEQLQGQQQTYGQPPYGQQRAAGALAAPPRYAVQQTSYVEADDGQAEVVLGSNVGQPGYLEEGMTASMPAGGYGAQCGNGAYSVYGDCGPAGGCYADGYPGDCYGAEGCAPPGWSPPGIERPWPAHEYLCDGGDRLPSVQVGHDWRVHGLDREDTIVHYDTIGGPTEVEPSNSVCIYAPRFGAVRQVTNFEQYANIEQAGRVHLPLVPGNATELLPPSTTLQRDQPIADIAIKQMTTLREQSPIAIAVKDVKAAEFAKGFLAFEDLAIIRWGQFDNTEKARLAERVDAAIAWSADTAVQVVIEGKEAGVVNHDTKAQTTYQVDLPAKGKLRVVKVASACDAKPGETVYFTIRFDNVGESAIGNVTLVDNLTTRLEFVPGSNQSNLAADFSTEPNENGSLIVRWELKEPLPAGQGGIVRFATKVR